MESSTLTRGTRSSVMGQDHLLAVDPQTSAAGPVTSPDVQLSLNIGIYRWVYFGGQTQMVVKMVVRPIAKLSEYAYRYGLANRASMLRLWDSDHCLAAESSRRCTRLGLTQVGY